VFFPISDAARLSLTYEFIPWMIATTATRTRRRRRARTIAATSPVRAMPTMTNAMGLMST
jgi:hypothetical protein